MLKIVAVALVVTGVAAAQSGGGDERVRDWSRIHELRPGHRIAVRPFKGMGSKVLATYVSSDAAKIVVRLENDQKLEIPKERVRSVIRRKRMRNAVLIGASAGFAVMALLTLSFSDFIQPLGALAFGSVGAGIGAGGGGLVQLVGQTMIVYRAD